MAVLGNVLRPTSAAEALQQRRERPGRVAFVAGGTGLFDAPGVCFDAVVDLAGIGFDQIEIEPDTLRLGALCRLQALLDDARLGELACARALRGALRQTRTWPWREQATLGGSVFQDAGADLLVPVLAALGAQATVLEEPDAAPATWPLADGLHRARTGLLLEIRIPRAPQRRIAFETLRRTALDRPLAGITLGFEISAGALHAVRVLVTPPALDAIVTPWAAAERGLENQSATTLARSLQAAPASGSVLDFVPPTFADDWRASGAYRAAMAPVLLQRALARLLGGGDPQGGATA